MRDFRLEDGGGGNKYTIHTSIGNFGLFPPVFTRELTDHDLEVSSKLDATAFAGSVTATDEEIRALLVSPRLGFAIGAFDPTLQAQVYMATAQAPPEATFSAAWRELEPHQAYVHGVCSLANPNHSAGHSRRRLGQVVLSAAEHLISERYPEKTVMYAHVEMSNAPSFGVFCGREWTGVGICPEARHHPAHDNAPDRVIFAKNIGLGRRIVAGATDSGLELPLPDAAYESDEASQSANRQRRIQIQHAFTTGLFLTSVYRDASGQAIARFSEGDQHFAQTFH